METHYKITWEPDPGERSVTLLLNGKFGAEAIPELKQSITEAKHAQARVYIDLSEVTLVDRKTVKYFCQAALENVKLINCPVYLRGWIRQVNDEIEN